MNISTQPHPPNLSLGLSSSSRHSSSLLSVTILDIIFIKDIIQNQATDDLLINVYYHHHHHVPPPLPLPYFSSRFSSFQQSFIASTEGSPSRDCALLHLLWYSRWIMYSLAFSS